MGALGCTQRTRGRRRVGSALEWQGGRRVSAHVQPARNFQGVSSAPGSAQHEQSVQDVSFASGRRPQLQRLGACKCAAWAQRAGCILCIWTRARLAAGHAALRAYTPRGRESTRRRSDDEMRSDGLWKGRSGGIGYAARDMARQVKWEDPALRREREKERERTRASGRRACEKEEREKERASESENERREDSREGAREARE